jgi:hypothetical protein
MTTTTSVELNLLDELFLNLDRADEPWTVHFEVRIDHRLDADRLSAAIAEAARRHPIARASLAAWRYSDRRYSWEIADELAHVPLEEVRCDDEAALERAREQLFSKSRRSTRRRRSPSCWPTAPAATRSCSTSTTAPATAWPPPG